MKFWHAIIFLFLTVNYASAEDRCAYVLSGYGSSPSRELYQEIGAQYDESGITPVYVEIDWSTRDILDYISQARKSMAACKGSEKYFYGFSLGGLIALGLAKESAPLSVVVSSVAPFFKEDIEPLAWYSPHSLYNWWLFGESETISAKEVVSDLNKSDTKVVLLVGSEEKELMIRRSSSLAKELHNGELVVMDGVGHGISKTGHMNYIVSSINE